MQIRELTLQELDTAYDVVKELRPSLDYDAFEDLIYDMRHQEYKMYGMFHHDVLICYAGVSVMVNLYWGRHLFVYDLVTREGFRSRGYGKEMLFYLQDIAKMFQCQCIALTSGQARTDAQRFYAHDGFEDVGKVFLKPLS